MHPRMHFNQSSNSEVQSMAASFPVPRLSDIRFSIRQLRKSPGFTLTAILTLALGIGAVTSVFSVVNAVLLKPFAFRDPGRLIVMREVVEEMRAQYPAIPFNYMHYLRLKKDSKTLEDAAIFQNHGVSVSRNGDHPNIIGAMAVSPNFFSVLGVQPVLGRDFTSEEATKGHSSVVVLTWNGWQELFNGDPNVLGRTLSMGGEPNTVIGVLPRDFRFPDVAMAPGMPASVSNAEGTRANTIFHPLVPDPEVLNSDVFDYNYLVVGRLRAGANLDQARAELDGLQKAHVLTAHLPIHIGIYLQPFLQDVTSDISSALWLLFAAVGAVLLIACVNLANLQLARAVATERETAVRAALGASRSQLLITRLTESLVLAVIGGLAGIALAFLGVRLLMAAAPSNVPRLSDVRVDLPVLVFAAGLSILTAVLFGVLPALRSLRVNPQSALQSNPTRVANTRQGSATRNLLVSAEVACTVVLLIITGLVLRSFSRVLRQDRGFDSSHVTMAQVDLYSPQYGDSAAALRLWRNCPESDPSPSPAPCLLPAIPGSTASTASIIPCRPASNQRSIFAGSVPAISPPCTLLLSMDATSPTPTAQIRTRCSSPSRLPASRFPARIPSATRSKASAAMKPSRQSSEWSPTPA